MARKKSSRNPSSAGSYAQPASGDDSAYVEDVKTISDEDLIKVVQQYRSEAEDARKDRMNLNRSNWNMYFGRQDWSHKEEGQSTEFLPKVGQAAEQFAAFVKKALTQFGDWFSVEVPKGSVLDENSARRLLLAYLDQIYVAPNKVTSFPVIISDALKAGMLETFIILKIHGCKIKEPIYVADPKDKTKLIRKVREVWRPRVDIVPSEDYYPDPTGRNLYEIHRVERDLVDVQRMAEQGIYDKEVVAKITEDFTKEQDYQQRRPEDKNQNYSTSPAFRKRVVLEEVYGTVLNLKGEIVYENGVCTIANEKYVIRKPEPNPFWHGRCPILAVPLIRVPFSVWGRALFDQAASLNQAMNELFNLMLDGGIAEVWGVRQVRTGWLEDPRQVSGGIPQTATLAIRDDVPVGGKVVETVTTGGVPQEAMQMFSLADREFQAASMTNDVRLGSLPPRQVKATEIVESSTSSAVMVDSLTSDIERELIDQALEMMFLNIMQNADDLGADEIVDLIGVDAAYALANMTAAERFAAFAKFTKFKAEGVSGTLNKVRDFQKLMALMQSVGSNPVMMQAFMERFSPQKTLTFIMKSINLDPTDIENSPEEAGMVQQRMGQVAQMSQVTGGSSQQASPQSGMASTQSEIAQDANPSGGPGINM